AKRDLVRAQEDLEDASLGVGVLASQEGVDRQPRRERFFRDLEEPRRRSHPGDGLDRLGRAGQPLADVQRGGEEVEARLRRAEISVADGEEARANELSEVPLVARSSADEVGERVRELRRQDLWLCCWTQGRDLSAHDLAFGWSSQWALGG